MKLLWRGAWIETPGYEVPDSGVLIEVAAAVPLVRVENASGRLTTAARAGRWPSSCSPTARAGRCARPAPSGTSPGSPVISASRWSSARSSGPGERVVALASRVPPAAQQLVIHREPGDSRSRRASPRMISRASPPGCRPRLTCSAASAGRASCTPGWSRRPSWCGCCGTALRPGEAPSAAPPAGAAEVLRPARRRRASGGHGSPAEVRRGSGGDAGGRTRRRRLHQDGDHPGAPQGEPVAVRGGQPRTADRRHGRPGVRLRAGHDGLRAGHRRDCPPPAWSSSRPRTTRTRTWPARRSRPGTGSSSRSRPP